SLFVAVVMPVVYPFDTGDGMAKDPFGDFRPDARACHKRPRGAAQVVQNPALHGRELLVQFFLALRKRIEGRRLRRSWRLALRRFPFSLALAAPGEHIGVVRHPGLSLDYFEDRLWQFQTPGVGLLARLARNPPFAVHNIGPLHSGDLLPALGG